MNRQEAEVVLQNRFHLPRFYDEQWSTIEKLIHGERVLLIEKTGFGKSLCFQFPALIFSGTTVVFSPLIALMRDQAKKLSTLGIPAKCINSEQSREENSNIIAEAKEGKIKILYIAPERQENPEWLEATRKLNLSMVVVDEAHCISVWGHDFRPAFKRIISLVKLLPKGLPVLATTATATPRIQNDIEQQMGSNLSVIRGKLMRDSFRLFVVKVNSEDEKLIWLGKNLERLPGTGLLYTGTRMDTEIYSKWLDHLGISSIGYNAGLDTESRIAIENGLMNNEWKCIISTNALGMGIDKPDIRYIIHTQMPQSPIHYYQEIGRAGRDGEPAYIILFYHPEDKRLPEVFIEGGRPSIAKYERVIRAIKNELLGEKDLMRKTNMNQTQIRVIKADLVEQKIIREVTFDRHKKFEYISGAPKLNTAHFEELRACKTDELEKMLGYIDTTDSRMKYLCSYLGDDSLPDFNNCDNTGQKKIKVIVTPEWEERLKTFRDTYFPEINAETKGTCLVKGVAASFYGFSNVGAAIHHSKYEHAGEFPDFLVMQTLKAFRAKFAKEQFDLMLYVPPTVSGDLVMNFAEKIAHALNIPLSHKLLKQRGTREQKVFENHILKHDNVAEAFMYASPDEISGKNILLIDDIFDSGASVKEIGRYLTQLGAASIAPLIIARTVGGDLSNS